MVVKRTAAATFAANVRTRSGGIVIDPLPCYSADFISFLAFSPATQGEAGSGSYRVYVFEFKRK